jgi:hypothetical protein
LNIIQWYKLSNEIKRSCLTKSTILPIFNLYANFHVKRMIAHRL